MASIAWAIRTATLAAIMMTNSELITLVSINMME
jgi:hypothetical protein